MDLFSLVAKLTLDADDFNKELDQAESKVEAFQMPETEPLTLDNSDFNESLSESESLTGGFEQSMSTSFANVSTALKTAGIVGSLAAIVGSLKQVIDMTAETADGIDKGAKRMGMSRTAYQEWDHALKQSGAGISDLKKGLLNFQKVQDATDPKNWKLPEEEMMRFGKTTSEVSDDVMDALNELNMMDDVTSGKFGSAEDMMEEALYRIADMSGDPNAQGILVRKLFGKGGDALLPMLADGREAVEDLVGEAGELGLIMSDTEIDNAVAYGDAVENLNAEMDAIKQAFVADIIPVLTSGVEWLTKLLNLFNPRTRENSLSETFAQIDSETTKSGAKIDETGAKADALITKLAGMGDYWSLDEQGKKTWNTLAEEFISLEPEFEKYIDLENKVIQGNTKEIEDNIKAWEKREKQRLLDENTAKKREAIAKKYAEAEEKLTEAEVKETDANAARTLAMEKFNDLLGSDEQKYGQMQSEFREKFGTGTVTTGNFAEAESWLMQNYKPYLADAGAVTDSKKWEEANRQADELRKSAEGMIAEADQATADLEKYEEALAKRLKLTTDEANNTTQAVKDLKKELDTLPSSVPIGFPLAGARAMTHAIGSSYIPFDNYPALLHRGEKILTATEARQEGQSMDFSGLEDRIEAAIRKGMDGAQVRSYLNGRDITDEVNRNNINAVKGRRFSG